MSNFPPFRAAPPKGETTPKAERTSELDDLRAEDKLLVDMLAHAATTDVSFTKADLPLDEPSGEAQHVEHVRCCAKCFSTEVVDAVKIGDAIYIKVS